LRFTAHSPDVGEPTNTVSVFSLRTSAFNDFLYAPVGEEDNGMVLTMLSALARSGLDPWGEAARLNELPRGAATKRLALMISGLPHGQWAQSAVAEIASRLVALLPATRSSGMTAHVPDIANARPEPAAKMKFFFFALIVILFGVQVMTVLRGREPSPPTNIADAPATSSQQSSTR
jgi:hypothetical protein